MKYLIFDVSAAGKPKTYKAPVEDTFVWPRLVHISWIILDDKYKPIGDFDLVVNPEGYTFDPKKLKSCHLDDEDFTKKGRPIVEILNLFKESLEEVDFVWSHNLSLNEKILGAEFIRADIRHNLHNAASYCLMQESTEYCKLPGKRGLDYKWPSLSELHAILFKKGFAPANNSRADVIAAARCFIMLSKIGALEDI